MAKTRAAGKAESKPKPRRSPAATTTASGPTTSESILQILKEGPNSPTAFSTRLGVPMNVIGLAIGRLSKQGKIEKLASGNFALKAAEPFPKAV